MKNTARISGIFLILLMAGSVNLSAQRGMRGMRNDSLYMKHDSLRMRLENRRMAIMNHDSLGRGMRNYHRMPGMEPGMRSHFGFCPCMMAPGMGMHGVWHPSYGTIQRGRGQRMMAYGPGRGEMMQRATGMRIIKNIPDLTAKQKDELTKLKEKQRDEMKKISEKQQEEIKNLRDAHRKKVMNILNDEQKKWMEENAPRDRIR